MKEKVYSQSGRICQDIHGEWKLHYYVRPEGPGKAEYRSMRATSEGDARAKAVEVGITHVFLGSGSNTLQPV